MLETADNTRSDNTPTIRLKCLNHLKALLVRDIWDMIIVDAHVRSKWAEKAHGVGYSL